ncbi:lysine-specific permease [Scheffersomyces amazonensis]|uniref:lysine-specific permease n=1 Tax=Scheffersomyces amazonensis TaxID=1078765 RepID=UPI00315D93E7
MVNETSWLLPNVNVNNQSVESEIEENPVQHVHTKRLLESRHIEMISLGGIIGTGLFIGIRSQLTNGPIISLISYGYVSIICYTIVQSVGEMSCYMPINGSLCQFQFKFLSNSIGFSINIIYWLSWSITLALELSLIYEMLLFWQIPFINNNQTLVIFSIWIILTIFNLFPVNYYGEIEFIISIIKVFFIIFWIGLAIYLIIIKDIGFKNWDSKFIWGIDTIHIIKDPFQSKLVNILGSLVASCFTFQSIESVAICSGEIHHAHKSLPRAIKYVLIRIIIFYMITLFLLTLLIKCNDPNLSNDQNDIFSSPFLIGLINAGINSSSFILNAFNSIIIISMISAANSNIYFGSRCLISIIETNFNINIFPKFLSITNTRGVPYPAILLTSSIGLISLASKFKTIEILFNLLINLCATSGLIMWLCISISYLRFCSALKFNNVLYENLRFHSKYPKLLKLLNWLSIGSIIIIILSNGLVNIWNFNWDNFISCYLTSIMLVSMSLFLSWYWNEPLLRSIDTIDIFTDQSPFAFTK